MIAIPLVGNPQLVEHETDELTAVCPVTGLPDFYHLSISYIPKGKVVELKSLKFFLMGFRDVGILHEDLAPAIMKEFVGVVDPESCKIDLTAATRGGISTRVIALYPENIVEKKPGGE